MNAYQIIPEIKTDSKNYYFTYSSEKIIENGTIVEIPLKNRIVRGMVMEKVQIPTKFALKPIKNITEIKLPEKYFEIIHWIAEYYLCSVGEALSMFLPPNLKRPRQDQKKFSAVQKSQNRLDVNQKKIFESLKKTLSSQNKKPALIFGVTGSGKTEIYLKIAEETIKKGQQVVVLVPEIILTPQTEQRFIEYFGDQIVLLHSNLSKSERLFGYLEFLSGRKKIVIGPRSALLVPSDNIGLIIVDEEHEESYKQEQNPRYNATTLAKKIAKHQDALLIYGSATPSIETFYSANHDQIDLYTIKSRHNNHSMPKATIIDLKDEIKAKNYSPISKKLFDEIQQTLNNKKQTILFMNRRGASTFVSCRECGQVINCPNCEIPAIFHLRNSGVLKCHHCEWSAPPPTICPVCNSLKIKYFGIGIEKIELEIRKLFPTAKIFRLDSETASSKSQMLSFYQDFKNKKYDIVVGTQMVGKSFDFPEVDLVGIVSADTGLHLPHFRSSEKTFRQITQVSGRSGRTNSNGQTVIQSYWPNSKSIHFAMNHDYTGFYESELKKRQKNFYPPFSHLVRILSEDQNKTLAEDKIKKLEKDLKNTKLDYIGPGPCFFQKLNNKFRYHIIIKTKKLPNPEITSLKNKFQDLIFDVDPTNIL